MGPLKLGAGLTGVERNPPRLRGSALIRTDGVVLLPGTTQPPTL